MGCEHQNNTCQRQQKGKGKGLMFNLLRNEWRSGSTSFSCCKEVGAPGFIIISRIRRQSIFAVFKIKIKIKIGLEKLARAYLSQPGLRQNSSAPVKEEVHFNAML